MRIRTQQPAELEAALALLARAFAAEPAVVDLVRDLSADEGYIAEYSLLAEDQGEVIGYLLLTRAWIGRDSADPLPALILAPLGVVPERQRSGVGTALVLEALRRARRDGERAVFVLGDPAYYGRFGFVPSSPLGLDPPQPVPDYPDAWQALELLEGALQGRRGTVSLAGPLEDPKYW